MALFLAINVFIYLGWYFWLAERRWSLLDTLLGSFVLSLCQCLCVMMLLGAFGRLRLLETSIASLAFSTTLIAIKIRMLPQNVQWSREKISTIIRQLTAASSAAVSLMLLGFVMLAVLTFYGQNRAWDGNMYHIPVATSRLQMANLDRLQGYWVQLVGFPQSGDMFILWNLIWMKSTQLADAAQVPFWIFGWLAIVSLAVKLGARPSHAMVSGLIWAFAPVALLQGKDALVDLMVAALIWIGLNFAYHKPISILSSALALASGFLLLGMKSSALFYVALILIFLFLNVYTSRASWKIPGRPLLSQ